MILKTYKHNRRVVCYIEQTSSGQFKACTGKPSDASRIAWTYNTQAEAEATAIEYFNNYTKGVLKHARKKLYKNTITTTRR